MVRKVNKRMRYNELIKEAEAQIRDLENKLAALPDNVRTRLISKIERAIKTASRGDTPRGGVASALSKIGDPDLDKQAFYNVVAKEMIGHELSTSEIATIIKAMKADKAVNKQEMMKVSSDIGKIFPQYGMSENTQAFYNDLFFMTPQRVGPGELLFCVMSKNITKGGKGDLTIGDDVGVEVKAGKTGGRFRDGDVMKIADGNLRNMQRDFVQKYPAPNKTGWSLKSIIGLLDQENIDPKDVVQRTTNIFKAIFPNNSYVSAFQSALAGKNTINLMKSYALANLETYYNAKGGKAQAFLFMNAKQMPAKTCYVNSYDDIRQGIDKVLKFSEISAAYIVDLSGNNEEYPKITLQAL